jgi:hypothetical protein
MIDESLVLSNVRLLEVVENTMDDMVYDAMVEPTPCQKAGHTPTGDGRRQFCVLIVPVMQQSISACDLVIPIIIFFKH